MPHQKRLRSPGIEPGSSAWEAPMMTITLRALVLDSVQFCGPPVWKCGAKTKIRASQRGLEPPIFGSGNRRLVHLATGTCTSSGTRTHNLTLRRGAPYPLGHGGTKISSRGLETANAPGGKKRGKKFMPGVGFEPTRTKRPADLKSAPLDPSGIQAK